MRELGGVYHQEMIGGQLDTRSSVSQDGGELSTIYGDSERNKQESKRQRGKEFAFKWMASKGICSQSNHDNDLLSALG